MANENILNLPVATSLTGQEWVPVSAQQELPSSNVTKRAQTSQLAQLVSVINVPTDPQSANTFLAGPTSGSAALTSFRNLAQADLAATNWVGNNVVLGGSAAGNLTSGTLNVVLGYQAVNNNIFTGTYNVVVGYQAGLNCSSTQFQVAVGAQALAALTSASTFHVAIGGQALGSLTTGGYNIGIGHASGLRLIDGNNNIAIGAFSLQQSQHAGNCIAIGFNALNAYNDGGQFGGNCVAVGSGAMANLTSGYENVGVGQVVLGSATSAYWCVGVGIAALQSTTEGYQNVAVGLSSLVFNTTGYNNTAIGMDAGATASNGTDFGNSTGHDNTYLGAFTANASSTQRNFQTIIGSQAIGVDVDNSVTIGRAADTVYIPGSQVVQGGKTTLAAAATSYAALSLPVGSAPSAPADGDIWREDNTNTGLKIRINGITKTIVVA